MRSDDDNFFSVVCTMLVLGTLAMFCVVKGCSDGPGAKRVLEAAGYSDITTGGYSFACADSLCTSFTATGPSGKRVSGAVGCGWVLKACTVRLDQ